jgi:ribosomal protein S14
MIISATLRRQVIERAGNRCEYCGLAQTTVVALNMNRPLALTIREEEAHRGRHPPQVHI